MAVQWQWLDDFKWIDYDKKTCNLLEKAYLEGKDKENCDKERFVEFCDIKKIHQNFSALPKDYKSLVGIQRRFDNPTRRRLVQRLIPATFDGYIIFILKDGLEEGVDSDGLADIIKLRKGKITTKITNSTLIICDEIDWSEDVKALIKKAIDDEIPIVTSSFVNESLDSYKLNAKDLKMKNTTFKKLLNEKKDVVKPVATSLKRIAQLDDLFQEKRKIDITLTLSNQFSIKETDDVKVTLENNGNSTDVAIKPNKITNISALLKNLAHQAELKFENDKITGSEGEGVLVNIN